MNVSNVSAIAEAVVSLAEQISRTAPECTEPAQRIVALVTSLDSEPDRATIEDALESQLVDSELSDPQLQTMTSAVARALREPG